MIQHVIYKFIKHFLFISLIKNSFYKTNWKKNGIIKSILCN